MLIGVAVSISFNNLGLLIMFLSTRFNVPPDAKHG
ncbi:Uncharacterised protein [Staphylococcus aureus]|nr:Uncharacterised protein [Staphylococcus aureus]